uniref:Bcl-2 Bcl-2 homology region 1-3 domain-containing protein n=1 Tax=Setaria digitata TaxID=48799 RepID=A0A915PVC6_9BILA
MNAVDLVAVKGDEQCGDNDMISESADILHGNNTIQSYVADYIQFRVRLHNGFCPRLPEFPVSDDYRFRLIRAVALIFENKHAEELRNMVTALCMDGRLTFQRYVEVVECFAQDDDNEPGERLSYGRLVALIAFAGLVAVKLCEMQSFSEVSMITSYTSKFLHKRIVLTWQQDKRSWESFFDRAKVIIDRNEEEKNAQLKLKSEYRWWLSISALAIFGIFGIGAFTLMKTVLKAR